jgi:DNA (cytosine-5)-methyltransferase 1
MGEGVSRKRPIALSLFCGAGGDSDGLHRAGFDVVGVDIEPMPEYPRRTGLTFVQADALTFPLEGYDFIWASPKCQFATAYKRRTGHVAESPNMIPMVRERLIASGVPYVIENVEGAREHLRGPVVLCGSMFNLDVQRHRLFEASFALEQLSCKHSIWTPRFPPATNRANLRRTVEVGVWRIPLEVQRHAMGIDWMSLETLSQAIPPAYAEWIGNAAMKAVS